MLYYLLAASLIGFFIMGLDKARARKQEWRIPEARLFLIALAGGALGMTMAMHLFRHKTKHPNFRYGLPLIAFGQIVLISYLKGL